MTNKEAIKRIKEHIAIHKYRESHAIHIVEALDMAISALQAKDSPKPTAESVQNVQNEDLILRKAAIDALAKHEKSNGHNYTLFVDIVSECAEIIRDLPSAQPEPSEITDEQAILHLQSTGWMQRHDKEMYESGLREQLADDSGSYDSLIPYEDTVSRQAAIRKLKRMATQAYIDKLNGSAETVINCCIDVIERQIPSAQPEWKKGKWQITDAYPHNVYCSECHTRFAQTHWAVWEDGSLPRNFCPNCGADMRGGIGSAYTKD